MFARPTKVTRASASASTSSGGWPVSRRGRSSHPSSPSKTVDATGFFNSFKMGPGTLEVTSPQYAGTASSDFFGNDIEPEFAFAPVVWETTAKMPGVAGFEISVTGEE